MKASVEEAEQEKRVLDRRVNWDDRIGYTEVGWSNSPTWEVEVKWLGVAACPILYRRHRRRRRRRQERISQYRLELSTGEKIRLTASPFFVRRIRHGVRSCCLLYLDSWPGR